MQEIYEKIYKISYLLLSLHPDIREITFQRLYKYVKTRLGRGAGDWVLTRERNSPIGQLMKKVLLSMALLVSVSANAQEITLNGLKYAVTDAKLKTARVMDEVSSKGATSYDVPATIEIGGGHVIR